MKITFFTVLLFIGISSFAQIQHFQGSFDEAVKTAKKENKAVFIDFYTDWCGWCKRLDQTTFKDDNITKIITDSYVFLKVNAEKEDGPAIARKAGVSGYPTMVIYQNNGKLAEKIVGYRTPEQLISVLEKYRPKRVKKEKVAGDTEQRYWQLKEPMYVELENQFFDLFDTKVQEQIELAQSYAVENKVFEYEELKLDIDGKAHAFIIEVVYLLEKNKTKEAEDILVKEFSHSSEPILLHYYVLKLMHHNYMTINMLRWINWVSINKKTYAVLDTKARVQFLLGDMEDAKETGKKAKKIASKQNLDATSIELTLSSI